MTPSRVADLTTEEVRELVREVVLQTLAELLGNSDEGLKPRSDVSVEVQRSLAAVTAGGKTASMTPLSLDELESLADQMADEFMEYVDPDCPPLSDYALSRQGLYEDHL